MFSQKGGVVEAVTLVEARAQNPLFQCILALERTPQDLEVAIPLSKAPHWIGSFRSI